MSEVLDMQSVEITGKSVAEATKLAASKLGVGEEALVVTVLEESKGLFGKSQVRIRAEAAAPAAAPAAAVVAAPAAAPAKKAPARGKAKVEKAEEEPVPAPEAKKPVRSTKKAKDEGAEAPAEEAAGESSPVEEVQATEADAKQLTAMVQDLLVKSGLDATVQYKELNGKYVTIEIDGKDAAFLIGRQGEVLNALQYICNIIANRRFNNGVRLTLDGANYRSRREASLETLASRIAEQVKIRQEEAVLDALPAFERRIIHKIISEMEGVKTYSEGEEPNRRVVIAPAD